MLAAIVFFAVVSCEKAADPGATKLANLVHAAEAGDAEAMYSVFVTIARRATPERHLSKDKMELSRYWLIKAGEHDNWCAAEVLQLCYEEGCAGLPIDLEKSKHYAAVVRANRPTTPLVKSPRGDAQKY